MLTNHHDSCVTITENTANCNGTEHVIQGQWSVLFYQYESSEQNHLKCSSLLTEVSSGYVWFVCVNLHILAIRDCCPIWFITV
jgi:hypothetical protein